MGYTPFLLLSSISEELPCENLLFFITPLAAVKVDEQLLLLQEEVMEVVGESSVSSLIQFKGRFLNGGIRRLLCLGTTFWLHEFRS